MDEQLHTMPLVMGDKKGGTLMTALFTSMRHMVASDVHFSRRPKTPPPKRPDSGEIRRPKAAAVVSRRDTDARYEDVVQLMSANFPLVLFFNNSDAAPSNDATHTHIEEKVPKNVAAIHTHCKAHQVNLGHKLCIRDAWGSSVSLLGAGSREVSENLKETPRGTSFPKPSEHLA